MSNPIQHGSNDATLDQKLDGLVAQVRVDYLQGTATDVAAVLQQRLIDSGIELDADAIAALAERVTAE